MPAARDPRVAFWTFVDKQGPDECWPWTGSVRKGRGRFHLRGAAVTAPRYAIELKTGSPVPPEKFACHHCDNPICVNPAHLYVGDALSNAQDMVRRGRSNRARGSSHPAAKIDEPMALAIREAYSAGGVSMKDLAERFDTTRTTVQKVVTGARWGHVGGPITNQPSGRPRRFPEAAEREIVARYEAGGITRKALAVERETSLDTIISILQRHRRR